VQLIERWVHGAVRDLASLIEVEALVEGLVERSPRGIRRVAIQLLRTLQQVETEAQHLNSDGELGAGVVETFACPAPLGLEFVQAFADLALRQGAVGGEVE